MRRAVGRVGHLGQMSWEKLPAPLKGGETTVEGRVRETCAEMMQALAGAEQIGAICQIFTLYPAQPLMMFHIVIGEIDTRVASCHRNWSDELLRAPWGVHGHRDVKVLEGENLEEAVGVSLNGVAVICMGFTFRLNLAIAVTLARDLFGLHPHDALQIALRYEHAELVKYIREGD